MRERLVCSEAFEIYYSMGNNRTLKELRKKLGPDKTPGGTGNLIGMTTLKRWSKKLNWQERIERRDIENIKQLEKKTNASIVNEKIQYRKVIKEAFDLFYENLRNGEVTVNSVQDAEKLVKLDMLLMGEATEHVKSSFLAEWGKEEAEEAE